jgi:anaerobic magnesium-protoporphyrin IX monomethyl ester cyclase
MPLPFAYLKSNITDAGHDVRIIDCTLHSMDAESCSLADQIEAFAPDVVGVSAMSTVVPEALALLRLAKDLVPQTTTVIGGSDATCYPEDLLNQSQVDFVFRGEAEFSFRDFLDGLTDGSCDWTAVAGLCFRSQTGPSHVAEPARVEDLDSVAIPDYDFVNLDGYIAAGYRLDAPTKRNAPIWTTRGCPYRCAFCSAPKINGKRVRTHSIDYLVKWVERLYFDKGIRWINILDDNFTYNTEYAAEFCKRIIEMRLPDLYFSTCNGIRMNKGNPELWRLMKRAGWQFIIIAPESGSERVLKLMKKDVRLERVPQVVNEIKDAGLLVKGFFLLGYPGESVDDIQETHKLIMNCPFDFVHFNNFQPLPGTEVFEALVQMGEIGGPVTVSNYSDGARCYTPIELKDFNFSRFVLSTYASLIIRNPKIIRYLIRHYNAPFLLKKLFLNLKSMLRAA